MTDIRRRTLLASALIPVGLLAVMLYIQHQRQGWPFSRQAVHAQAVQAAPQAASDLLSARVPVDISARQIEILGVQTELVDTQRLDYPVRAVATIVADESRIVHVHTRVSGWLEELYVNTTGERVRVGQPLGAIFSQELYSSQSEYLSALRRSGSAPASAVLDAARTRLTLLGMSDAEIARIEDTGEVRRLVTITAPRSGIVLNRGVSQGTAVDPSTEILTLVDLSQVWVIAEVAEADAARVSAGTTATLSFPMSGRSSFTASLQFVYPTLTERTRTVRVRMTARNADGLLRPGMYGSALFPIAARDALTVGRDAVVDTGDSQHVFVHTPKNVFEPRQVRVGARLEDRVEILEGLAPGEHVVTAGVFLIDSESRLRASGGAGHAGHGGSPAQGESDRTNQPTQHEH
ncbi:efflux RND transporter periplasmic adaptor subunit [Immundisolibacter sp.]|uniref:efflux RND transporter periplasmic adaptor subunit n=1 Tax=Immundisolibacter sp. TaxID=1934948 RepID=UPI002B08F4D8|nr:efflux RND transporter periplasmic adaptor subunit [Immundisolibacter sp.]MEA3221062.1 Multidrug resistance protein MdtA [Immundisolibacter sp.]